MSETQIYSLRVNGKLRDVTDAWLGESLLYVLRERLDSQAPRERASKVSVVVVRS